MQLAGKKVVVVGGYLFRSSGPVARLIAACMTSGFMTGSTIYLDGGALVA